MQSSVADIEPVGHLHELVKPTLCLKLVDLPEDEKAQLVDNRLHLDVVVLNVAPTNSRQKLYDIADFDFLNLLAQE